MKLLADSIIQLRRAIVKYPWLFDALKSLRGRFVEESEVAQEFRKRLKKMDEAYFVQIGSNDGLQGDPLRAFVLKNKRWRGVFVEPVPYVYERLCKNYGYSQRFIFENVAIGNTTGVYPFYYLPLETGYGKGRSLPYWCDQVGSFDLSHVKRHCDAGMESMIVKEKVECITLLELLKRHSVKKLDILHLDTEGHDFSILKELDLVELRPTVILFEVKHMTKDERCNLCSKLDKAGYSVTVDSMDGLATLGEK